MEIIPGDIQQQQQLVDRFQGDNQLSCNPEIMNKYRTASQICQYVLQELIQACRPGVLVADLCQLGDEKIQEHCAKVYTKKSLEKGISHPVTVGVNQCLPGCYSPSRTQTVVLKEGDVVKIDLGCHIDGYMVTAGHTLVLAPQQQQQQPIEGPLADVICATYFANELLLRAIRPGVTSTELAGIVEMVAECFHVKPVCAPVLSLVKRFLPETGEKVLEYTEYGFDLEKEFTVDVDEVYVINAMMTSSATGRPKESDMFPPTLLQRNVMESYQLKRQSSRAAYSYISETYGVFPFSLRDVEDNLTVRMGLQECLTHQLIHHLPVLHLNRSDVLAQFKITAALLPSASSSLGSMKDGDGAWMVYRLTGGDVEVPYVRSEYALTPELAQLMQVEVKGVKPMVAGQQQQGSADAMEI